MCVLYCRFTFLPTESYGMLVDYLLLSILKQDRQCTYDVTLRRVRETIVAVEKQEVLLILSVCL